MNLRLLEVLFRGRGWAADPVSDGRAFLDTALAKPFDLAVVDACLPELDGLEAIRLLLAARPDSPPVLVVTAAALPGDRERCLAAGASAYLAKPFQTHELWYLVDLLTRTAE